MKNTTAFIWIIASNVILFCLLYGYNHFNDRNNTSEIDSLTDQVRTLEAENQKLRLSLEESKIPQQAVSTSRDQQNQDSLPQSPLKSELSDQDPNTAVTQETRLSPQTLEAIQGALRQFRQKKTTLQNGTDEVARLQQENEQLKEEIAGLRSQLNVLQTGGAVLAEIQNEKQQIENLLASVSAEFGANTNPNQKIKLFESLSELSVNQEAGLLPLIQQGLYDPYPEVRQAAMDLLENYHSADAIPLLSTALDALDTETRLAAVESLENIQDPAVADLFLKAINDKEEEVRSAALDKTDKHPDDIQMSVYEAGILSAYSDVRSETLSLLELRGDHKSVDIALLGLKSTDAEFKEEVNSTLSFLVDKEFESYDQGKKWWDKNKDRYDENLVEK